ncbi:DUF6677 family protein [Neorhodopirellula lusitana]|uniref:DUF6677 family protein n=1 Tax=Neorhodopirellula lusitana TaxID=445327 RepID=UPI00384A4B4C
MACLSPTKKFSHNECTVCSVRTGRASATLSAARPQRRIDANIDIPIHLHNGFPLGRLKGLLTPQENGSLTLKSRNTLAGKSSKKGKEATIELSPEVLNGDTRIEVDDIEIDLKNRYLAAFLAWLIPGAGHFYQGRHAKGTLFVLSVLSIWFLGFSLGGGHVVYASWANGDRRWHYFLQAGVGAAAIPALVQGDRMRRATDPSTGRTLDSYKPLWGGFMAPPHRPVIESESDEIAAWYAVYGSGYEMGTWFTMIAGLLNFLVIYDAFGGPLAVPISGRASKKE